MKLKILFLFVFVLGFNMSAVAVTGSDHEDKTKTEISADADFTTPITINDFVSVREDIPDLKSIKEVTLDHAGYNIVQTAFFVGIRASIFYKYHYTRYWCIVDKVKPGNNSNLYKSPPNLHLNQNFSLNS